MRPKLELNLRQKLETNSRQKLEMNLRPKLETNSRPKLEINLRLKLETNSRPKLETNQGLNLTHIVIILYAAVICFVSKSAFSIKKLINLNLK